MVARAVRALAVASVVACACAASAAASRVDTDGGAAAAGADGSQTAPAGAERGPAAGDFFEHAVVVEINAVRRERGLRPLRRSPGLAAAASRHTAGMASLGVFAHELPGGPRFARRFRTRYRPLGRGWSVAENLAVMWPTLTAREAVRMWLGSPPHRRNLLSPRWRDIGVAVLFAPAAPGDFGDSDVTLVTADFGVRR